jgi:hypothetical protein
MSARLLFRAARRVVEQTINATNATNATWSVYRRKRPLVYMIEATGNDFHSIPKPLQTQINAASRGSRTSLSFVFEYSLSPPSSLSPVSSRNSRSNNKDNSNSQTEIVAFVMHDSNASETEIVAVENILRVASALLLQRSSLQLSQLVTHETCQPRNQVLLFLYLLRVPKTLPQKPPIRFLGHSQPNSSPLSRSRSRSRPLGRVDVNSAFTYACSQSHHRRNVICVFRAEELLKVLIHESVHLVGADVSHHLSVLPSLDAHMARSFALRKDREYRFEEAYTEFLATALQCMLLASNWTTFTKKMRVECLYAVQQADRVLRYHGLSFDTLIMSGHTFVGEYHEETSVFAYYVLKSILLWQYETVLAECGNGNMVRPEQVLQWMISGADDSRWRAAMRDAALVNDDGSNRSLRMTYWGDSDSRFRAA